ncbi:MAG: LAGLIDADG family homing endonuclease [Patescibacteria group bacterium]
MILPGDYVSGLVDGEGCFSLNYRRDVRRERKGSPVYFRWKASFSIVMRKDEYPLLGSVRDTIGDGDITYTKGNVSYQVQDTISLQKVVIPFFTKHALYGKKSKDFQLWCEAIKILIRNRRKVQKTDSARETGHKHWDEADLIRLQTIRAQMRQYKSKRGAYKWN